LSKDSDFAIEVPSVEQRIDVFHLIHCRLHSSKRQGGRLARSIRSRTAAHRYFEKFIGSVAIGDVGMLRPYKNYRSSAGLGDSTHCGAGRDDALAITAMHAGP
jgi:hypothetical protein